MCHDANELLCSACHKPLNCYALEGRTYSIALTYMYLLKYIYNNISQYNMSVPNLIFLLPAWYLDCGPLGKETKALLFITIDTPLFSTYGVDLSIDWGDFTTPIEKRYDFLSTGIRHSVPLAHTYYYTGEFDVTLTATISRSTNDNAALASRSTGDWPMGRTIRTDNWTIFVDRTQCTNDYDPEALDTSDGKRHHHLGGAAFVVTMASSLLLYVWL